MKPRSPNAHISKMRALQSGPQSQLQLPPASNPRNNNDDLLADILSKIGAEGLTDIVLLSNDGGQVPASRFVISARSAVFQSLLFRTGENLNQQVLQLDYSINIVRALVKYCCTNELPEEGWRARTEGVARELVRLYDAAAAFDLVGLNALLCKKITVLVQTHPNLACAVYDECSSYSRSSGGGVPTPGNPRGRHSGDASNARTPQVLEKPKAIALKAIRHNPMAALLKKNEHGNQEAGVSAFGTGTIEEIIVSLRAYIIDHGGIFAVQSLSEHF